MSEKKKKVLFVHHGGVIGGAPVSLLNTVLGIKKHSDYDVKILCVNRTMQDFFERKGNIETGRISNPGKFFGKVMIGWASLAKLSGLIGFLKELLLLPFLIQQQYRILKKENPDIVHLNSSILFSTAIAAKKAKIKIVWHVREVFLGGRFSLKKKIAAYLVKSIADRVICISPVEARSLGRDKKNNVKVVYNFVDFQKYDYSKYNQIEEKKKLGLKETDRLVVSLGGLSFRKGTFQIIEAMKYLDNSNIKLLIAGQPVNDSAYCLKKLKRMKFLLALEDFLIRLGIKKVYSWSYNERLLDTCQKIDSNRYSFLGFMEEVVSLIAACDMLIFAGTTPHFPRPVFEAWAMNKPVLVFDMDGIKQNIDDQSDGIIVKKSTGKALAQAIETLVQAPEMGKAMGKTGYKKAYELFRSDVNVKKIIAIYDCLL